MKTILIAVLFLSSSLYAGSYSSSGFRSSSFSSGRSMSFSSSSSSTRSSSISFSKASSSSSYTKPSSSSFTKSSTSYSKPSSYSTSAYRSYTYRPSYYSPYGSYNNFGIIPTSVNYSSPLNNMWFWMYMMNNNNNNHHSVFTQTNSLDNWDGNEEEHKPAFSDSTVITIIAVSVFVLIAILVFCAIFN